MPNATPRRRRLEQPTTWGNPPIKQNLRFTRYFGGLLRRINRWLKIVAIGLVVLCVAELLYVTYGVVYVQPYASDGTDFSCKIEVQKGQ